MEIRLSDIKEDIKKILYNIMEISDEIVENQNIFEDIKKGEMDSVLFISWLVEVEEKYKMEFEEDILTLYEKEIAYLIDTISQIILDYEEKKRCCII